ncbi:MAG: hypothetical protein IKZ09_03385 [Clostridia bacterium]|nr:hypothetical protein [Clostridia bacterium]
MTNEKNELRAHIRTSLLAMKQANLDAANMLQDTVPLTDYASLAKVTKTGTVWTAALQTALDEHEHVIIPSSDEVYYIDDTVTIPSNRKISAYGATVRLTSDCDVLMLRNRHTVDGTHAPVDRSHPDVNITVCGGRWEESRDRRAGYSRTGRATHRSPDTDDRTRPFYGVSTLFYFGNVRGLTLTDLTFAHTAGFSVQTGALENGVFEHIRFDACFADGLHLNGDSENLWIYDIAGEVGDDLVALNMYDWQNSSVNFGPMRRVWCEGLDLAASSPYKALRIEPGTYYFDDGASVDCGLFDTVIRDVRGIVTFKMYYQTPRYALFREKPERGAVGSADNLFFENITVDLDRPIDAFDAYLNSDPVRGAFGAFELGSNIGYISFSDIDITLHRDRFPLSYLVTVGPKSIRADEYEIFDPYLSSHVGVLALENIRVNGEVTAHPEQLIHCTAFDDINGDGMSTGAGTIGRIEIT